MRAELEALADWIDAFFEGDTDPVNDDIKALVAKARASLTPVPPAAQDDPCSLGGRHVDDFACDGETVRCRRCGMAFGSAAFWRENDKPAPREDKPVPGGGSRFTHPAAPSVPSVRVRIPVAVTTDGDWNAIGWRDGSDEQKRDNTIDPFDGETLRISWVEAEVPLPVEASSVVQGVVVPGAGGGQ